MSVLKSTSVKRAIGIDEHGIDVAPHGDLAELRADVHLPAAVGRGLHPRRTARPAAAMHHHLDVVATVEHALRFGRHIDQRGQARVGSSRATCCMTACTALPLAVPNRPPRRLGRSLGPGSLRLPGSVASWSSVSGWRRPTASPKRSPGATTSSSVSSSSSEQRALHQADVGGRAGSVAEGLGDAAGCPDPANLAVGAIQLVGLVDDA